MCDCRWWVGLRSASWSEPLIVAKFVPSIPPLTLRIAFRLLLLYEGFTFVLGSSTARKEVALPAGLATLGTAIVARFLRRTRDNHPRPPRPDESTEYHI